ncbi:MAG TPA: MBL fold metallo-hydrolase RNA specificity domain-containing protein [Lacipirellulaceae bacterium]|jgi:Cft2 family RNA processing exonuclease|nr:MBL fold metallo-hydrolase RNA specificity domain-containing protein [Lacipirellulaceae bacterium]
MFHYDAGLFLTAAQLGVDVRRRQPRCFVSHAHADHIARHQLALATRGTAHLYRHRLGLHHRVLEMEYRRPVEFGGLRLTAYPAGHCLGSAMLFADNGEQSLLYTGDYKLGPSATSEPAEPPHADILVMESTFGRPKYRLPPRESVIARLLDLVHAALAEEKTPIVHAYPLGKSQEVTKILTDSGVPVLQHQVVYEVSRIYAECGVDLGDFACFDGRPLAGHAVVTMPRSAKHFRLPNLGRTVSIAVTGWAVDEGTKHRLGVDHALPLSDHADYNQLIETVRRVEPREIFCTHGPVEFADHLRDLGFNAFPLQPAPQRRLF